METKSESLFIPRLRAILELGASRNLERKWFIKISHASSILELKASMVVDASSCFLVLISCLNLANYTHSEQDTINGQ